MGRDRAYADEVAAIYRGYRAGLERAGLVDAELFAWRALDALRLEPGRPGAPTPVFVYGFDDFTVLELDALEVLSARCGAEVTVSLPYEAGRLAFKAVAAVHARLSELAAERIELPPLDDHYADSSRPALHQIERGLFELDPPAPVDAGEAVAFHEAAGARAEVELAGARVLQLLREGTSPGDVAVVFRDPGRYSTLVEQVFGAYGVPYSIDRSLPLAHTGVGRGLLALVRCAAGDGTADDLLAYLRTPGLLKQPALADRLEAEAAQGGARSRRATRARSGSASTGPSTSWTGWPAPPPRRCTSTSWSGCWSGCSPRPTTAAPPCWPARSSTRPAPSRRPAPRWPSSAPWWSTTSAPGSTAGGWPTCSGRCTCTWARTRSPTGCRWRGPRRSAPAASRPCWCSGSRRASSRAARRPSRSFPTTCAGRSPRRAGSCSPCARTASTASATSSTSAPRRAERVLVLSSRTSDEEGGLAVPSFFLDDVRFLLSARPPPAARWPT